MKQWQLHTPEGVADLLSESCRDKRELEQKLRQNFERHGYREVETPTIEFFDVYDAKVGAVAQEELFKFFDERGRILCLRYDGTLPVARLAATVLKEEKPPLRLSYVGSMFRYREFGGGRQREFTQAGIELLGDASAQADAEIIATAITAALQCGIKDLHISIGQVAFFKALLEYWQIEGSDAKLMPQLINRKEMVALEELYTRLDLPSVARSMFNKLATGYSQDILSDFDGSIEHEGARKALSNLRQVIDILEDYGYKDYVSIDLGMLQSIDYYTGIIFKGYTYDLGFPLLSGGRYDSLMKAFDRDLAATGFSIGVNFLLSALRRQNPKTSQAKAVVELAYASMQRRQAFQQAAALRQEGQGVVCIASSADDAAEHFAANEPTRFTRRAFIEATGTLVWEE